MKTTKYLPIYDEKKSFTWTTKVLNQTQNNCIAKNKNWIKYK